MDAIQNISLGEIIDYVTNESLKRVKQLKEVELVNKVSPKGEQTYTIYFTNNFNHTTHIEGKWNVSYKGALEIVNQFKNK